MNTIKQHYWGKSLKNSCLSIFTLTILIVVCNNAIAAPGILQIATRQGFWSNEFPDKLFLLQHYRHVDGDISTPTGTQDFEQHLSLSRLIDSWHFGERNQYQLVMQGVFPFTNFSVGNTSVTGFADPLTYTAFGWNNVSKTVHVQLFSIIRYPFGESNLTTDAFGNITGIGYQHRWGKLQLDASTGYWIEFDQEGASNTSGKSYWELNGILSYKLTDKISIYNQWDVTITDESEIAGVGQNDDGHNFGTAIGASYNIAPGFQIDAKAYSDLGDENEAIEEDLTFNVRILKVF